MDLAAVPTADVAPTTVTYTSQRTTCLSTSKAEEEETVHSPLEKDMAAAATLEEKMVKQRNAEFVDRKNISKPVVHSDSVELAAHQDPEADRQHFTSHQQPQLRLVGHYFMGTSSLGRPVPDQSEVGP